MENLACECSVKKCNAGIRNITLFLVILLGSRYLGRHATLLTRKRCVTIQITTAKARLRHTSLKFIFSCISVMLVFNEEVGYKLFVFNCK